MAVHQDYELKVKTYIKQISCNMKSICFNPFTQHYNSFRQGWGMVAPNCLHGRRDSTHLGNRKCMYHFTPLAQCPVEDLVLIIDYLWRPSELTKLTGEQLGTV